jgi:hypothetical protein
VGVGRKPRGPGGVNYRICRRRSLLRSLERPCKRVKQRLCMVAEPSSDMAVGLSSDQRTHQVSSLNPHQSRSWWGFFCSRSVQPELTPEKPQEGAGEVGEIHPESGRRQPGAGARAWGGILASRDKSSQSGRRNYRLTRQLGGCPAHGHV